MLTIGHRGAMGYAPENTLLSIRKAIELGCDWVEIDVYLVDDELIVIHDETLERTTNGTGCIFDYSFDQLRQLNAGQGQKIPLLQEVLDLTMGKVGLNIEIKGVGVAVVLIELISKLPRADCEHILISSFNMQELINVKKLGKEFNIGVLTEGCLENSLQWAQRLGAYSIHCDVGSVSLGFVNRVHRSGFKLYAYTVDDIKGINDIKLMGVDGVFSNYPDRVK